MKSGAIFALLLLFFLSCLPAVLTAPIQFPLRDKPLKPGMSGVYLHKDTNILHVYYGSDHLREHSKHLEENQAKFPENKEPFLVGPPGSKKNRGKAMKGIKIKPGCVRDEKPVNCVEHSGEGVTVKHLPKKESSKHLFFFDCMQYFVLKQYPPVVESNLMRKAASVARKSGAKIKFHPNHTKEGSKRPGKK
jgi:hypothetical protein